MIPISAHFCLQACKPISIVVSKRSHSPATYRKEFCTSIGRIFIAMIETYAWNDRNIIKPMTSHHAIISIAKEQVVVIIMKAIIGSLKIHEGLQFIGKLSKIKLYILIAICKPCHKTPLAYFLNFGKVIGCALRISITIEKVISIKSKRSH